jgi:hypothetical protein
MSVLSRATLVLVCLAPCCLALQTLKVRPYEPPKCQLTSCHLCASITQKTVFFIVTTVRILYPDVIGPQANIMTASPLVAEVSVNFCGQRLSRCR